MFCVVFMSKTPEWVHALQHLRSAALQSVRMDPSPFGSLPGDGGEGMSSLELKARLIEGLKSAGVMDDMKVCVAQVLNRRCCAFAASVVRALLPC